MIKYDKDGELIVGFLDDKGVISKERIKKEDYKSFKKEFDEVIELLALNKLFHSMFSEELNYEIDEKLEFKIFVDPYYETVTLGTINDYVSYEDNQIYTMDKIHYEQFHDLCYELLIKVKRSWSKLNKVEKFIIKCLEFDEPPKTDEEVTDTLGYDNKKYYQYKESGFIKLGIQLKVGHAKRNKTVDGTIIKDIVLASENDQVLNIR